MTDSVTKSLSSVPDCNINDTFILELKDAELHRKITYINNSDFEIPLSLNDKSIDYPYHCGDFHVFIDEKEINEDKIDKQGTYFCCLKIMMEEIKIPSHGSVNIIITCRWEDFYYFLSNLHYGFNYPDVAKYRLIIQNYSLKNILHIISINGKQAINNIDYNIQDNILLFNEIDIEPNRFYTINLFSISTPPDIGILKNIQSADKNIFSGFAIILIQHLLSDVIHLISTFNELGADKDGIFIVGIPYSTKHTTVKYLKHHGFNNIWIPSKYPFLEHVKQAIIHAIDYCVKTNKKILIVEDGGYAVPLFHREFLNKKEFFVGAVEQTTNGINLDKDIKDENKKKLKLVIPVVNVAQSKIKNSIEGPLIGRTVSKNIELIYEKSFSGIAGKKIGLVGYGTIGKEVAKSLKGRSSIVQIYDKEATAKSEARVDGYEVFESIIDLIKASQMIVESTGNVWTSNKNEMRRIIFSFKNNSYFVSASSKKMGIDPDEFKRLVYESETINWPGVGVKYKLRNDEGNYVILIADGYPINFFLGESVPDKEIAFILAWLYKCTEILAIKSRDIKPGIIDTNNENDKFGFFKAQNEITELNELTIN
jgi:adenosylhomocysteinase